MKRSIPVRCPAILVATRGDSGGNLQTGQGSDKAGSDIVFEVHLHSELASRDGPDETGCSCQEIPNRGTDAFCGAWDPFKIPQGDPNYVSMRRLKCAGSDAGRTASHHANRGKDLEYRIVLRRRDAATPEVRSTNWPGRLVQPGGARSCCRAGGRRSNERRQFDNSENNPENHDPTKDGDWGNEWDEMMVAFQYGDDASWRRRILVREYR